MKILQVIHQFPRSGGAGAENYTRQICREMSREHDISLITMGSKFFDGPFAQFHRTDEPEIPVYAYFRHPSNTGSPEKEYWKPELDQAFEVFVGSWQPDIIHFQHALQLSVSLITAAVRMGLPTYFTAHDFWTICPNIVKLNWKNQPCSEMTAAKCKHCMSHKFKAPRIFTASTELYLQRQERIIQALNQCQGVLCPSLFLQEELRKFGVSDSVIKHWPFGIQQASANITAKSINTKTNTPVKFAYTGTLAPQKGVHVLLKAFAALPETLRQKASLTIYGNPDTDGATRRRVRRWRSTYSRFPEISFAGPYNSGELMKIHSELDVVVVPSIWYENRPLTILEALIRRNPVIGSEIGGIPELISGENSTGWTFPAGDTAALSHIMASIIKDPDQIGLKRAQIQPVPTLHDEINNLLTMYRESLH